MSASGVLKVLEATAFSSLVGAFRAHGDLTPEKKEILTGVADLFKISHERYKAEIRRAISDDTLSEIAEKVAGPGTESSWIPEGRRNVKLLKRKPPKMSATLQEYLAKLAETEAVQPPTPVLRQPPACPPTLPADFSAILLADQMTPPIESSASDSVPAVEEEKGKKGVRKDRGKEREEEEPVAKKVAAEKQVSSDVVDLDDSTSSDIMSANDSIIDSPPLLVPMNFQRSRPPPPSDLALRNVKPPPRPIRQMEPLASRTEPIRLPQPPKQLPMSRIFPIPAPPELPLDQQIRASFKPERGTLTPIRSQVKYVTLPPGSLAQQRPSSMPARSSSLSSTRLALIPKGPVKHVTIQSRAQKAPLPRLLTQPRAISPRLPSAEPPKSLKAPPSKDQLLSQGAPQSGEKPQASTSKPAPEAESAAASEPNWTEILAGGEQGEAISLDEAVTLLENTPDAKNILQYIANSLEQGQTKGFSGTDQISFEDFEHVK